MIYDSILPYGKTQRLDRQKSMQLESDQVTETIQLKTYKFKQNTEYLAHREDMPVVRGENLTLEITSQATVLI